MAQLLDGNPIDLLDEFMGCRIKLFHDGSGVIKLCAGGKILQIAGEIAGNA